LRRAAGRAVLSRPAGRAEGRLGADVTADAHASSRAGKDDAFLAVDLAFLRRRSRLGLARGQFGRIRGLQREERADPDRLNNRKLHATSAFYFEANYDLARRAAIQFIVD
jgi:hypothetical protein